MNKNEQQMYKDISAIAKALTKLIRMIEKERLQPYKYERNSKKQNKTRY